MDDYTYKCEYCGKLYDCREGQYGVHIHGEKFEKATCSLECAKKYKNKIILEAKYKYLAIKRNTKIIEYKEKIQRDNE